MIRQTRIYLVGAMSGATLIAIAIAAFVMLVSAQVFSDWPLSALRGSGDEAGVSAAETAGSNADTGEAGAASVAATAAGGGDGAARGSGDRADGAAQPTGVEGAGAPVTAVGEEGGNGAGEGAADGGSDSPAAASPGSTAPGDSGSTTDSGSGGSNGNGSGDESPVETVTSSPSRTATETVNDTVSGVDQSALGGTLEKTGATNVTEEVVNGVAGPESTVGQVVDGTVDAVGGLLIPKR